MLVAVDARRLYRRFEKQKGTWLAYTLLVNDTQAVFLYYFLTPTVRSETCAIFWSLRQSRKSIIRVFTVCRLTYFERESTVAAIIVLLIIFALIGFVRTRFAKHPLSYHSGYETQFTVVCVVSVDLASLPCRSFKTAFQTKHNNNNSMNINWENNEA